MCLCKLIIDAYNLIQSLKIVIGNPSISLVALEVLVDSCNVPMSPLATGLPLDDQFSIAIRKCNHSTHNPHPIYNYYLSPSYYVFILFLSFVSIPRNIREAPLDLGWQQAIIDETIASHTINP